MNWKGTFNADVVGFRIKRNAAHDGKEAELDIEIGVKEDDAEKKFGEDFAKLAFATKRVIEADPADPESTDAIGYLVDKIKPGRRYVLEQHLIQIGEHDITCQPELLSIEPVDGEARVVAKVRIPVDVSKKSVINSLVQMVGGEVVKVKFDPRQQGFEFGQRGNSRGNGHNLGEPGNGNGAHEDGDEAQPEAQA